MPETQIGRNIASWSESSRTEFKRDLEKLPKVPYELLQRLVEKVASTLPACNPADLIAYEAEQSGNAQNRQALTDAISTFVSIWENSEGGADSPRAIAADLKSLGFLSNDSAKILEDLLTFAQPLREGAKARASYINGLPPESAGWIIRNSHSVSPGFVGQRRAA